MEYHFGKQTGVGYSRNLSESGVFIECAEPAAAGQRIYMRLYLPEKPAYALKIIGLVKRVEPASSDTPGMGIQFEVAYAKTRDALLAFIEETIAFGQSRQPIADHEYHPETTDWREVRRSMTVDDLNQSVEFNADAGPLRMRVRIAIALLVIAALGGLAYLIQWTKRTALSTDPRWHQDASAVQKPANQKPANQKRGRKS